MQEDLKEALTRNHLITFQHSGVSLLGVQNAEKGIEEANKILIEIVDNKTVLFLSGGSTPQDLYRDFALDQFIHPAAVAMVDERYGEKMHGDSNEKMIHDTNLLSYLSNKNIPFYPILQEQPKSREKTAEEYEETVRYLLQHIPRSLAILGIGPDGHTSSIVPNRPDFDNPMFSGYQKGLLVSEFNDQKSSYKERIGLTFLGLSMIDLLIVLAFGSNKLHALKQMFNNGSEHEIPARFFTRPEIAPKSLIITDQEV